MTDQEKLAALREWASAEVMKRPWPLGDGTAVMLQMRREVLDILTGGSAPASGAYGIPQSLPGSKKASDDFQAQIQWALGHIKERYSALDGPSVGQGCRGLGQRGYSVTSCG
jgi:resuscitation-promoting factor RpfB